jgi:hypothetical protein
MPDEHAVGGHRKIAGVAVVPTGHTIRKDDRLSAECQLARIEGLRHEVIVPQEEQVSGRGVGYMSSSGHHGASLLLIGLGLDVSGEDAVVVCPIAYRHVEKVAPVGKKLRLLV